MTASDTPAADPPGPQAFRDALAALSENVARGNFPAAETNARLLLRLVPSEAGLLHILGTTLGPQGRGSEAVRSFRRALIAQPGYVDAAFALANEQASSGAGAASVRHFRCVLRLAPGHVEAAINLGNQYGSDHAVARARALYRRALAIAPETALAQTNLGAVSDAGATVVHFRRARAIVPDDVDVLLNLANAERDWNDLERAFTDYVRAHALDPDHAGVPIHVVEAMGRTFTPPPIVILRSMRRLLIACLEHPEIDSNTVNTFSQALLRDDFGVSEATAKTCGMEACPGSLDGASEGLLSAHLSDSLITDTALEVFLTTVRRRMVLDKAEEGDGADGCDSLARALAYQGMLNEFLWDAGPDEEAAADQLADRLCDMMEMGGVVDRAMFFLLAAYRPVASIPEVRAWAARARGTADPEFAAALDFLVLDRVREEALARGIEDITAIDDVVSLLVKSQYEENPYPRWNGLRRDQPVDAVAHIRHEIEPNRPELQDRIARPRVLIAGCGTGRQAIQAAMTYAGASVLGVDLSIASLAYAKRRANDLGFGAIRFVRGDILHLGAIDERFDVIECSGVLHHMARPEDGLASLLRLLAPGGFVKLALYSRAARENVTRLRHWIAEQEFEPTLAGMRAFRARIRDGAHPDAEDTRRSQDFYAASAVRDLLFHAQEHQYTVPMLRRLIEDHGLEFLGFLFARPVIKQAYALRFPDDPACIDLGNWEQFERENPLVFVSMYQFWCRGPATIAC